jgi:two-component SAPR family response regulator
MKAILIDDEPLALVYLEYQLANLAPCQIVGKYTDPISGIESVDKQDVDIVFLDIHMPVMNGLELAEQLMERKPGIHVIFVTAYDDYAVQAFELNAIDYLLKPVQQERLIKTVKRLEQRMQRLSPQQRTERTAVKWRMRLFNNVTLTTDAGEEIPLQWRTKKAQQLFLYLLHHRGSIVDKTEIIEWLWSDMELSKAFSQLYTTIYLIRKTLEPLKERFVLQSTSDGYRMQINDIELDIDAVERFLQFEIPLTADTVPEYERILKLFQGEYLQEVDHANLDIERERYRTQWLHRKMKLVKWYYDRLNFEQALKHCEQLCDRFPLEEEAHFMYMKICDKLRYPFLVKRQYALLASNLENELNEKPSSEIVRWYNAWRLRNYALNRS